MPVLRLDFAEFESRISTLHEIVEIFATQRSFFEGFPDAVWGNVAQLGKVSPTELAALAMVSQAFEGIDAGFQNLVANLRVALDLFRDTDQIQASDHTRLSEMITTISTKAAYDQPSWLSGALVGVFTGVRKGNCAAAASAGKAASCG